MRYVTHTAPGPRASIWENEPRLLPYYERQRKGVGPGFVPGPTTRRGIEPPT